MLRYTVLPSSALRLTGTDRLDFAQGQMSGNIKATPVPGLTEACFLNVKGQIEQFARIYRREGDLYLHLDEGRAPELAARFRRYIIFDQVEVQDVSGELASLHVWPGEWPTGWDAAGADAQSFELGGGTVLAGRVNRAGTPGLDLHYLQRKQAEVLAALAGQDVPLAELEAARIAAGRSDVQADHWQGVLPQEVGLEGAVHNRKGCYIGQEIMARLEARGQTRYALGQLRGVQVAPHAEVRAGERVVGLTGASTGTLALARLRRELLAGEHLGELTVDGQPVVVHPLEDVAAAQP